MTRFEQELALAEKLESLSLWRRAARQWLVVLDVTPTPAEKFRDHIAHRRDRCINFGNCFCGPDGGMSTARLGVTLEGEEA